jgi:hypothetical protein
MKPARASYFPLGDGMGTIRGDHRRVPGSWRAARGVAQCLADHARPLVLNRCAAAEGAGQTRHALVLGGQRRHGQGQSCLTCAVRRHGCSTRRNKGCAARPKTTKPGDTLLSALLLGGDGLVYCLVNAEDLRQACDPEDLEYPLLRAYDVEGAIVRTHAL